MGTPILTAHRYSLTWFSHFLLEDFNIQIYNGSALIPFLVQLRLQVSTTRINIIRLKGTNTVARPQKENTTHDICRSYRHLNLYSSSHLNISNSLGCCKPPSNAKIKIDACELLVPIFQCQFKCI